MNVFQLVQKRILITGASSGIGRATALQLAKQGANLVLTARNIERLTDTLNSLPHPERHTLLPTDLTQTASLKQLVKDLGVLDGIVHAAGIVKPYPIEILSEKYLHQLHSINYQAPVLLTSQLLRKRKINKGSSIVFISSIVSEVTYKGGAIYAGTKAALEAFSQTLALEQAHKGIRSNCVAPGIVETPMLQSLDPTYLKSLKSRYPLGFCQAKDVAHAIIFLLSPLSSKITGTKLIIDGGFCAG